MIDPLGGPAYLPFVAALIVGYLIGSVPFGLLIVRAAGAGDVRQIGSGNIGATNVLRTGRKILALTTFLADLAKGLVPTLLAYWAFGPSVAAVVGLGTVLGHCLPVWLKFKGGKGVATAAGVMLALTPPVFLAAFAAFALAVYTTRYVSLGSILAALVAPPLAYALGDVQAAGLYLAIALVVVVRHAANIKRLLSGTESRTSV